MKQPKRIELLQDIQKILQERGKTHGEPAKQLALLNQLKLILRPHYARLTAVEQEVLDMLLVKITRMLTGEPTLDHWLDIIGYAAIGAEARDSYRVVMQSKPNVYWAAVNTSPPQNWGAAKAPYPNWDGTRFKDDL